MGSTQFFSIYTYDSKVIRKAAMIRKAARPKLSPPRSTAAGAGGTLGSAQPSVRSAGCATKMRGADHKGVAAWRRYERSLPKIAIHSVSVPGFTSSAHRGSIERQRAALRGTV